MSKTSRGKFYERLALLYCFWRRYRVLAKNLRIAGGEIDLLVRARDGAIVIVEVRGRATREFLPRDMITPGKRARLLRMARVLERRYESVVRVELLEIAGLSMTRLAID